MRKPLLGALQTRVLLGDGAMGTQLQLAGLEPGGCGEQWNVTAPERVIQIQKRYADAGSDCLITNTFGSSRLTLVRHGLESEAYAFSKAGAEIARKVMGEDRYVLGDIGPFGGLLEPYGEVTLEQASAAFEEQARGLADGGVDAFIIETMTALEELECAAKACRKVAPQVPIIASMAYDKMRGGGYKTMMGVSPEAAAETMARVGADVFACNCGTGIDINDYSTIVAAYRAKTANPIMAQPNAGMPKLEDDNVIYEETPEMMAEGVWGLVRAGANIVGGCCGTTPEHIRQFRAELDKL